MLQLKGELPSMTSSSLRTATLADLPLVEQLLVEAGLPTAGVAELFESDSTQFHVFVSEAGSNDILAVGAIEVRGSVALLRSVAVRESWKGHGLGQKLVTSLVHDAQSRGMRTLYLLTTTAENYFPKLGFGRITREEVPADIASTVEFSSACPASAIVMSRSLVSS
jgi:amino-acid N-acetyltransferase